MDLGPFQPIWDAWDESKEVTIRKPDSHFEKAIQVQMDEINEVEPSGNFHYDIQASLKCQCIACSKNRKANEVVDIISISLNWLRQMGYDPDDIVKLVFARASKRYNGQTFDIFQKYLERYGI